MKDLAPIPYRKPKLTAFALVLSDFSISAFPDTATAVLLNAWSQNPLNVYYQYVLGLSPKEPAQHIVRGLWIHDCLEQYYLTGDWQKRHGEWASRTVMPQGGEFSREIYRTLRGYEYYYQDDDIEVLSTDWFSTVFTLFVVLWSTINVRPSEVLATASSLPRKIYPQGKGENCRKPAASYSGADVYVAVCASSGGFGSRVEFASENIPAGELRL